MWRGILSRAALWALPGLSACAHTFAFSPERRADTNPAYRTETFVVRPPPGRWSVDTLRADIPGAGRAIEADSSFACGRTLARPLCVAEALTETPLQGYVFCQVMEKQLEILEAATDSVAKCVLFRAYRLPPRYRDRAGNEAALARLADTHSATTDTHLGDLSLWEALTRPHPRHPVRGALRAVTIGDRTYQRLAIVFQSDTTKLFPKAFQQDVLIDILPDRLLVIAVESRVLFPPWLGPSSALWPVVASLRLNEPPAPSIQP